jgi:hypothetical protein
MGSKGKVAIAIFSSTSFDATTIDPTTVTLAGAGVNIKKNGKAHFSFEDIN